MTESVESYRARNQSRRSRANDDREYVGGKSDDDYDREIREDFTSACSDIDSLISEIERLTRALQRSQL